MCTGGAHGGADHEAGENARGDATRLDGNVRPCSAASGWCFGTTIATMRLFMGEACMHDAQYLWMRNLGQTFGLIGKAVSQCWPEYPQAAVRYDTRIDAQVHECESRDAVSSRCISESETIRLTLEACSSLV